MLADSGKKEALIRYLKRRGWLDLPFSAEGKQDYEPLDEEIAEILDLFFSFHAQEKDITPTGLGGATISRKKIFMLSYRPEGWEKSEKEYYDTIVKDNSGYQFLTHNVFLRDAGLDFAPDEKTFEKVSTLHRLCSRYGAGYIESVPPDDRDYFEWYLKIVTSRVPRIEERHFRNNIISEFCSFSVIKDFLKLAYLTFRDDAIMEEWDKQRNLPPEQCHDKLFLEVFTKLGQKKLVYRILNDLWTRGEAWALFRLLEMIKTGFVVERQGLSKVPLVEARLLSLGEKVTGDYGRDDMKKLLELSEGEFPKHLFDSENAPTPSHDSPF